MPVVNHALAHCTTDTPLARPRCTTPDCSQRAVFRATVDIHFPLEGVPSTRPDACYRTVCLVCLACYAVLRQGQAVGYGEILAVEAL